MFRKSLLLLFAAFLIIWPSAAQDDDFNPVLDMLARVPDVPLARAGLVYTDFRAMEAARGINTPTLEDVEQQNLTSQVWFATLTGVFPGSRATGFLVNGEFSEIPLGLPDETFSNDMLLAMPDEVGFSFFDIDRAIVFGRKPLTGRLMTGTFHPGKVGDAYAARDYNQRTIAGATVWCGRDGCENGMRPHPGGGLIGNPFDGVWGEHHPLAVKLNYMFTSPRMDLVEGTLYAAVDDVPSLADAPEYVAIAEVLPLFGTPITVHYLDPEQISQADLRRRYPDRLTAKRHIEELGELPPYMLAAIADMDQGDEKMALLMMVYPDQPTARTATRTLINRFTTVRSTTFGVLSDNLTRAGAYDRLAVPNTRRSDSTHLYVMVFPIPYGPMPVHVRYDPENIVFGILKGEIYGGTEWIATSYLLPEE